jgi:hypothetical protein
VTVTIDPDSGATVQVTGPGGPYDFSGSGGSQQLAPGSYAWTATSGSGFELTGDEEGAFTIDPCEASVVVTHGNCIVGAATAFGAVTVVIDPDSAATVSILNAASQVVGTFTGTGGTQALPAGSYTWEGDAAGGFTLTGVAAGSFIVLPCPDEVLGEVIVDDDPVADEVEEVVVLPFTGIDTDLLFAASLVLLGSGAFLIRFARRREEG